MIRLTIIAADILPQEQYRLDGGQDMSADRTALISRLGARLGRQKVRKFIPSDSHIPEQCMLALPALDAPLLQKLPDRWGVPVPGEPPLRPLFLFDPPEAIAVLAEVPDGPPHRFGWRRKTYHVSRYEGPERIAAPWWQDAVGHRARNSALTRDYYRVEDVRGRRYWLFRHGLYGREKGNPRWYIHGLFA
jgi:protein ImuB